MNTILLPADAEGITAAAMYLARGRLVAFPTETVYGLGADARNPAAVAQVYAAKGRPSFNPLIVHVADLDAAARHAEIPPEAADLAQAFWPGPLTLVLPRRGDGGLADLVTAGLDRVAIRVPAHPVAQMLLHAFGGPLAGPSANASGRISPTEPAHVIDPDGGLAGRIAAVIDAGPCAVGVESTIIGWDGQGVPVLLRPGGLPAEAVEQALGRELGRLAGDVQRPTAPGQLTSHYAPNATVRLNATEARGDETLIGFGTVAGRLNLSPNGDLTEAAAQLFGMLRQADRIGRPIAVAPIPDHGLGHAINDRLRRAAAPRIVSG